MDSELLEKLRMIREPETGVNIVELGMIDRITVQNGVYEIHVNFAYLKSSCKACIPISWMVVRSLVRKIERVMRESGLRYRIIEAGRGEVYAQG
jgi:metal-sulfur cluster biosynthetic enzyme